MEWILWVLGALGIVVVLGVGYGIYDNVTADKFSLRKDEWVCTKSHEETVTILVAAGKVMIPQIQVHTICDQWTRKA